MLKSLMLKLLFLAVFVLVNTALSTPFQASSKLSSKETSIPPYYKTNLAAPTLSFQLSNENLFTTVLIPSITSIGIKYRDITNYWFIGFKSSIKEVDMKDDNFMFIKSETNRVEFSKLSYSSLFGGFFYPILPLSEIATITVELEGSLIVLKNEEKQVGYMGFGIAPSVSLHKQFSNKWILSNSIGINYRNLTTGIIDNKRGSLSSSITGSGLIARIDLAYVF
jgi:hypothetical protein